MQDGLLTSGTLTPAYGRDYTNGRDARADFEAGKDFILHIYGAGRNGPCGKADFAPGARIIIRFKAQRSTVAHVVGSTVPAKKTVTSKQRQAMGFGTGRKARAFVAPDYERTDASRTDRASEPTVEPTRAFRIDVYADDSGKPAGNALRFATRAEANAYARDLAARWFLVKSWDVVETPGPVLHEWTADGRLVSL